MRPSIPSVLRLRWIALLMTIWLLPHPAAGQVLYGSITGTIPDYASTAKGLLLSGVVGGGPAEKAGLAKGDVLIDCLGRQGWYSRQTMGKAEA